MHSVNDLTFNVKICSISAWWRHQMETFSALLVLYVGNSPVTGQFPSQRPVTRSFDVLFHLRLKKRLSKLPWGWWFETPSRSSWPYCNLVLPPSAAAAELMTAIEVYWPPDGVLSCINYIFVTLVFHLTNLSIYVSIVSLAMEVNCMIPYFPVKYSWRKGKTNASLSTKHQKAHT